MWAVVVVTEPRRIAVAITSALALLVLFFYQPGRPEAVIASTAFPIVDTGESEELYFCGRPILDRSAERIERRVRAAN